MSITLRRLVIIVKKDLYKRLSDLDADEIAIEEEYEFADDDKLLEREARLLALQSSREDLVRKIYRAGIFSRSYASKDDPKCIACFVEREQLPEMVETETDILPTKLYFCKLCGTKLRIEPF